MEFIIGLPKTRRKQDSIMVVVYKLSKEEHFIPINYTFKAINIVEILMEEIFTLHSMTKILISNHDDKFNSTLCNGLFKGMGTNLNFSIAYHPQSNSQTERTKQILQDILRIYVMDRLSKWGEYLNLMEVTYNNGYKTYSKMSPFKLLYGI